MADLTIHGLDERIVAALQVRAEAGSCGVDDIVKDILNGTFPLTAQERAARFAEIRESLRHHSNERYGEDSTQMIRGDRDSR